MKKFILFMTLFLVSFYVSAQRDTVKSRDPWKNNRAGNGFYKNKQYDKAEQKYRDALKTDSISSVSNYNLGNSLYEQGKYDEAADAYDKAARTSGGDTAINAYYNKGNTLFKQGDLEGSEEAYKEALKRDPNNEDARENLAKVQKMIKVRKEKMQGLKDTTGSFKKDPNGKFQKKDPNGNNKTFKLDSSGNKNNKNGNGPKIPLDPKKQSMSPDEARKVMSALKDSEQKNRQRLNQQDGGSLYKPSREKDW